MKAKRLVCVLLMMLMAVVAVAMVACHKDREPGDETGTYYCEKDGSEYYLNLNGGNRFALELKDEKISGEFTIDGDRITFTPKDGDSFGGSYNGTNDTVWVEKEGGLMFVRMVEFTVDFNTHGGSAVAPVNVTNGKRLPLPQAPTYADHLFRGWYYDEGYTQAFNNDPIVKSFTLHARWADITNATEYTIGFDLNYEGSKELASVRTQGSGLSEVITPEARSGFNFGGWWISDSENGNELSRKYTQETVFEQDTTLFAYWTPTTGLLEPQAEINSTGVIWNRIPEASFKVEVLNASNETVISENPSAERLDIAWKDLPAGFYTVKVTYTKSGQSATATRCYLNKGLNRVSNFSVEGTTLVYGEVPNAEKYIVTVLCGNDKHSHENVDNDNYTVYEFGNCPPVTEGENAGNIVISVTAVASGYASSTAKTVIHRALDEIEEIFIDPETEIASWEPVKNATNYILSIADCENAAHNHNSINIGNTRSFDLSECYAEAGKALTISVYPAAKGYYSAQPTTKSFTRTRPMAPSNIKIKGSKITWDAVEGATAYTVNVGGTSKSVSTPEIELDTVDWKVGENYVVEIVTVKGSESSVTKKIDVSFVEIYETLKYNAGLLSWRHVVKVDHYEVYVNDERVLGNFNGNSASIEFKKAGANEIKVVAFIDAAGDEYYEAKLTVNTYKVTLNANGGEFAGGITTEYYKAKGDMLKFAVPTRDKHTFAGWYLTPFGGSGNGARFDDTVFFNDSDIYLYADWVGVSLDVGYEAGSNAASGFPTSAKIAYGERYKLDVPEAIDGTKIFAGWASTPNATVADLTDAKGNSYGAWQLYYDNDEEEQKTYKVYAVWINAFAIVDEYSSTVTIKGADGLKYVDEIVVPEQIVVNGVNKTVVGISDLGFQNYKNLKKISFPNSIKEIDNFVFRGITNLLEIEVYDAGEKEPVFVSDDGVLLMTDQSSDMYEIIAFPCAKTTYTIPSNVSQIRNYAFYKSYITSINIPATVDRINANAFEGCRRLRSLTFADSSSLNFEIGFQAFKDCTGLTSLALPARLVDFHFKEESGPSDENMAFVGCTSLASVSIDARSTIFKSSNGCLLNLDADKLVWCPEGRKGTFSMPTTVTSIGPNAFKGVSGLEIEIRTGTDFTIGSYAFSGASFEKLTFGGEGNITIGGNAFSNASGNGIRNLVIPATVKTIGQNAFSNCNAIEAITIEVLNTFIDNNAFSGSASSRLKSIVIRSANNTGNCSVTLGRTLVEGTGDSNVFSGYSSLTNIDISADYINIPFSYAISGNTSVKNLRIAATKSLSMYSSNKSGMHKEAIKADCKSYESVEISGLNDEGSAPNFEGLFANCTNLKKVKIAGTASIFIGANAFYGCTSLKEENLSLPDNLIYFDSSSFANTGLELNNENGATYLKYNGNAHYALMSIADKDITSFDVNKDTKVICSNVFKSFTSLRTVTFHEGLVGIGESAFESCSYLSSAIVLPDTLVGIGSKAFYYAASSADITIGTGLRFIGESAFDVNGQKSGKIIVKDINAWFKITFANLSANPVYKAYRLYDTSGNEIKVAKPTGITTINAYAAFNWQGLTEVVIPEGVTYIGERAFADGSGNSYLSNLAKVTFPTTLEEVATMAFYNCTKIEELVIKDSATLAKIKFGSYGDPRQVSRICVVKYSDVVEEVVIDEETRTIAANMYNGLTTLKKLVIHRNVTTIKSNAFGGCNNIERIEYGGTLADWLKIMFEDGGSNPWKNNATLVVYADDKKTQIEYPRNSTIEVPRSVTSIGKYTFYEGNLQTIILHEAIESIGTQAFAGCGTLRNVVVPNVESWFTITFEGATTAGTGAADPNLGKINTSNPLACNPNVKFCVGSVSKPMTTLTTPSKIATLKQYVFSGADCFEKIIISSAVTSIQGGAFTGCKAAIEFESGSNLKTIESDVFNAYEGTATMKLPDSVRSIGANAFYSCKFSSIVLGNKVEAIRANAFMNCTNLSSISLPDGLTTIGASAFRNCSNLSTLFIPKTVKTVSDQPFSGCNRLTLRIEYASESDLPDDWKTSAPNWKTGLSESRILYGQTR